MTDIRGERSDGGLDTARQRGLAKMKEVYGWDMPADAPGALYQATVDHLFGEIWARPGLTTRDRRLLVLGALTALGVHDMAEIHVGAAFRNGEFDAEQLREIALFLCHYVGWPNGSKLDAVIGKTVKGQE